MSEACTHPVFLAHVRELGTINPEIDPARHALVARRIEGFFADRGLRAGEDLRVRRRASELRAVSRGLSPGGVA